MQFTAEYSSCIQPTFFCTRLSSSHKEKRCGGGGGVGGTGGGGGEGEGEGEVRKAHESEHKAQRRGAQSQSNNNIGAPCKHACLQAYADYEGLYLVNNI